MSRRVCGGNELKVCEIASVTLRFGGRSTPGGIGGRAVCAAWPLTAGSIVGASVSTGFSSLVCWCGQSTLILRPPTS